MARVHRTTKTRIDRLLRGILLFGIWMLVWQVVFLLIGHDVLFASPLHVLLRMVQLVQEGPFWITLLTSLARIMAGLTLGVVTGIALAVITTSSRVLSDLFAPLIGTIKSTPVTSFIVLALLWISRGRVPVFISFLMVLPVVWASITEGIRRRDPELIEMARLFGMNRTTRLRLVDIPMVLPYFIAAFNSAFGLAWKAGITAEVIANPAFSIGGQIYNAKVYLETTDLFAWTAVLILVSVLLEKALRRGMRRCAVLMHIRTEISS